MYKFGPTFFVRNGQAQVVSRGDHLIMRWQTGGLVTTLIPLGNNVFFDPTFWSTISFEHTGDETSIKYKAYGFAEVYAAIRLDAR